MKKLVIYTDGGARGNPGPSGIGAVLYDLEGNILDEISEYIGTATNNQAEYKAVLAAIERAHVLGAEMIDFYIDSELVVKQMNKEYKVKNKDLAALFVKIYNKTLSFKKVTFTHIRREKNEEADKLVNLAIDDHINKKNI
ncbi:ribonuclease HI family protein [bacterium]|nr:ribonuclease HI family protein [bacterium]